MLHGTPPPPLQIMGRSEVVLSESSQRGISGCVDIDTSVVIYFVGEGMFSNGAN